MNRDMIYTIFFDRIAKNTHYLEEIVFPVIETGRQLQTILLLLEEIREYKDYLTILELLEKQPMHYITWTTLMFNFLISELEERLTQFEERVHLFLDERY